MPVKIDDIQRIFVVTEGNLQFKTNQKRRLVKVEYTPPSTGSSKFITILPRGNSSALRKNVRFNSETGHLLHSTEIEKIANHPGAVGIMEAKDSCVLSVSLPVGYRPLANSKINIFVQQLTGNVFDEALKEEAVRAWVDVNNDYYDCSYISVAIGREKPLESDARDLLVGDRVEEADGTGGDDGNEQNGDGNEQNGDGNEQNGDGNEENGDGNEQNGDGNEQNGDGNGQVVVGNGQVVGDNGENAGWSHFGRNIIDAFRNLTGWEIFKIFMVLWIGFLIIVTDRECNKIPRDRKGPICQGFEYLDEKLG